MLQVWTFNDRVAFVLSVTENGQPVQDGMKLQRLRQLLLRMMDEQGTGIVSIKKVGHSVQVLGLRDWQGKPAGTAILKMTCCQSLAGAALAQDTSACRR